MIGAAAIFAGFAILAGGGAYAIGRSLGRPRAGAVAAVCVLVFLSALWLALLRWVFPNLTGLG